MTSRDTCVRCVLRRVDDPQIDFDANGVCSHCRAYDTRMEAHPAATGRLAALCDEIKRAGEGREYDSVVGVSGGVDSSYAAYLVRKAGLRPLAVHLDNGWNSELAVSNIERLVKALSLDLYTHVIAWNEFRDLQLAYLRASVIDIEAITDHAIMATLYRVAARHGIRYVLTGENKATEGILPSAWVHYKNDLPNIRAIHREFGTVPLKTFPTLGLPRLLYYTRVRGIRLVSVLDHVPYVKSEAKEILAREVGWRDYGGKHFESVFTRFYQAYILPTKFGVDKRRSHLSTLICAGQLTRDEALRELDRPPYDLVLLGEEKVFVCKKLGLEPEEFDLMMAAAPRSHLEFHSYLKAVPVLRPVVRRWRALRRRMGGRASANV